VQNPPTGWDRNIHAGGPGNWGHIGTTGEPSDEQAITTVTRGVPPQQINKLAEW